MSVYLLMDVESSTLEVKINEMSFLMYKEFEDLRKKYGKETKYYVAAIGLIANYKSSYYGKKENDVLKVIADKFKGVNIEFDWSQEFKNALERYKKEQLEYATSMKMALNVKKILNRSLDSLEAVADKNNELEELIEELSKDMTTNAKDITTLNNGIIEGVVNQIRLAKELSISIGKMDELIKAVEIEIGKNNNRQIRGRDSIGRREE